MIVLTGGPDKICQFRRRFRELFNILDGASVTEDVRRQASVALEELERFRTGDTQRIIDGVRVLLERRFAGADQDLVESAYAEIREGIAQLKAKHPW